MSDAEPIPFARTALALAAAVAIVSVAMALTRAPPTRPPAPATTMADATANLAQQLAIRPLDPEAWRMLGLARGAQGDYRGAAAAFAQAARRLPKDADLRSAYGEALAQAAGGRVTADATQAFHAALAIDPAEPRARYYLALAREQAGDRTGAVADWRKLLADAPKDAPWRPLVQQALARADK